MKIACIGGGPASLYFALLCKKRLPHVEIDVFEQNRADVQATVVQAWSQLAAAKAQLESDNAQVAALSTALAGVREEERVGQRTLLDVLNAEQELLNAQVNLVSTKRNIVVAHYTLVSTIGRLNVQEIGRAHV